MIAVNKPLVVANLPKAGEIENLSKEELVKVIQDSLMPLNDPEQYKELVRASIPEFVKEIETKEDVGTAMFKSAQEMNLVFVDVLKRYYGFRSEQITALLAHVQDLLQGVEELEEGNLNILSAHSMNRVGDIVEDIGIDGLMAKLAETRFRKERANRTGEDLPIASKVKPFIKQLTRAKKNKEILHG